MRIGSDDNYFSVERLGADGALATWRIEAAVGHEGWHSVGVSDDVQVSVSDETRVHLTDFEADKIRRFETHFMGGGWLRLKRDLSGSVLLRYRVVQVSVGAALEGAILLKREDAEQFCRQLKGLI